MAMLLGDVRSRPWGRHLRPRVKFGRDTGVSPIAKSKINNTPLRFQTGVKKDCHVVREVAVSNWSDEHLENLQSKSIKLLVCGVIAINFFRACS
jgi:hypothetical protein